MKCDVTKKDLVVLAVGNPLMSDEGIAIHIIRRFLEHRISYPAVDFVDAGTGGMSILHLIAGRRKAVIIDCAYMGTQAGTIRRFEPDEVVSEKKLTLYSLHETDPLRIIRLSMQLGQCPDKVAIFGIEPEIVEPGLNLSKTLAAKIDDYVELISRDFVL